MAFSFHLECSSIGAHGNISHKELEDTEDYAYLVMVASNLIEEVGCKFHMGGFGVDRWYMDVGYHMSSFVEQLPELLFGIRGQEFVEVDLYPQGIERTLKFFPAGDLVRIECESRTNWNPDPGVEFLSRNDLVAMLSRLATDFSQVIQACDSPISRIPPFREWSNGDV